VDLVTRLVLIRHGESMSSVNRTMGGPRSCAGLSPLGRKQAEALADRLARTGEVRADLLVASAYPRARETADIVAAAIGDPPSQIVEDLGEHDPGEECDGLPWDDAIATHAPDWETIWEHDPYVSGFPGAESIGEFHHRVAGALLRVLRENVGRTIVVVCHGGVIDRALRILLKLPFTGGFELNTLNTSLTELHLIRPGRWRLLRYNDAAHLEGLPETAPAG
jgi:2,3-bisphosphoglycerate-dependent phosphoglycerate mutase